MYYSFHFRVFDKHTKSLLAFIALSAAKSSAQTRIHSAILVINTSNSASYYQVHWLVRTPYLSIKANNDLHCCQLCIPMYLVLFFFYNIHCTWVRELYISYIMLIPSEKAVSLDSLDVNKSLMFLTIVKIFNTV